MPCDVSWKDLDILPTGPVDEVYLDALRRDGWDVASTGMRMGFRKEWSLWHSLREFVQNALDEVGATDVTVVRKGDRVATVVRDNGSGFGVQALLLGEQKGATEEQKHCLRGRFGEGMKIGVLPILRAGGRIFIRTVWIDISFLDGVVRMAGQPQRVVVVLTRPNQNPQGTCVAIDGLDAEHYQFIDANGAPVGDPADLRLRFGPVLTAKRPDLVLHTAQGGPGPYDACKVRQLLNVPGAIYVRDIFVKHDPSAVFGYNLWFDDAASVLDPNRDKLTASPYDIRMAREFGVLLAQMPPDLLLQWLRAVMIPPDASSDVVSIVRGGFERRVLDYMDDTFLASLGSEFMQRMHEAVAALVGTKDFSWGEEPRDAKTLEHNATKNIARFLPESIGRALIKVGLVHSPKAIREATGDEARIEILTEKKVRDFAMHVILTDEAGLQSDVLKVYRTVEKRLNELAKLLSGRDIPVYLYVGSGDELEKKKPGFGGAARIGIRMDVIDRGEAVEVIIHEVAHAVSGREDLDDTFETEIARTGVRLVDVVRKSGRNRDQWYAGLVAALEAMRDMRYSARVVNGRGSIVIDSVYEYHGSTHHSLAGLLHEQGFLFFTGRKG